MKTRGGTQSDSETSMRPKGDPAMNCGRPELDRVGEDFEASNQSVAIEAPSLRIARRARGIVGADAADATPRTRARCVARATARGQ